MNHLKDLETFVDIKQIPIKYLIGIHRFKEEFPTKEDVQWEIIHHCYNHDSNKFTVKALGRSIFEETINEKQEQFLNKTIKLLIEDNKLEEDDRKDRYLITKDTYIFND